MLDSSPQAPSVPRSGENDVQQCVKSRHSQHDIAGYLAVEATQSMAYHQRRRAHAERRRQLTSGDERVERYLLAALASGPRPAREVLAGRPKSCSPTRLLMAGHRLGVRSVDPGGRWLWALPASPAGLGDDQAGTMPDDSPDDSPDDDEAQQRRFAAILARWRTDTLRPMA